MAKHVKILTLIFLSLFACFFVINLIFTSEIMLAITISLGVTAYHFTMRLVVGLIINGVFKNRINHTLWWFRERSFEKRLFSMLRVRRWKKFMPTYDQKHFDVENRGITYVLGATCQAEIVHEIIVLLAFLPLVLIHFFGSPWVFIITSIASALIDCPFIIIQRFNRPRLVYVLKKYSKNPVNRTKTA